MVDEVVAHDQAETHHYVIHFPPHPPRTSDPHYRDFNEFHRRTKATAVCAFAQRTGDNSECDHDHPLELHHSHIEFSLQNGVDLKWLERDYPGVSDPGEGGRVGGVSGESSLVLPVSSSRARWGSHGRRVRL